MSFKDMIVYDVHKVFLNVDEFAERRTIKYAGQVFKDIAVSLQELGGSDREQDESDHAQGLSQTFVTLSCAAKDLGGSHLKQGDPIEIIRRANGKEFRKRYTVVSAACEMGMIEAELRTVV